MRILSIEDNEMNQQVISLFLEASGIEVTTVSNGRMGVEAIQALDAFDVILLDSRMPDMDGYDVLRAVRARQDQKGRVPIVVLPADGARELESRCLGLGADAFVRKPISRTELLEVIGRAIATQEREIVFE